MKKKKKDRGGNSLEDPLLIVRDSSGMPGFQTPPFSSHIKTGCPIFKAHLALKMDNSYKSYLLILDDFVTSSQIHANTLRCLE